MVKVAKNGKVKLQAWIPSTVDTQLRQLIMQKYHRFEKGFYSYEVEMALRNYTALHTGTQSLLGNHPNPTPKVMIAYDKVKQYLLTHGFEELPSGTQVHIKFIETAIMNVHGSDPRTVEKWKKTFHKMGLIKPTSGVTWEVM